METNGQKETEKQKTGVKLINLGTANKNKVVISSPKGDLALIFSCSEIISFNCCGGELSGEMTIKNTHSQTTGKLINECCPNKLERVEKEVFEEALTKAFNLIFKNE